jgi:hypothetical protein
MRIIKINTVEINKENNNKIYHITMELNTKDKELALLLRTVLSTPDYNYPLEEL